MSVFPDCYSGIGTRHIERHIFAAHFVECADNTAFEDRPEAFDGLSMDCSDDVLAPGMVHSGMREVFAKTLIASPLIGAEQADFIRDGFSNESFQRGSLDVCDNAGDNVSPAADSAYDWSFARTDTAGSTATAALIPMPILCQTADESLIDLDYAAEFPNIFHKSHADLMAHFPRGLVRTEAHAAHDLQRAHAFFAREHEMNDAIPVAERFIRVFEDCSCNVGKAITVRRALFALPVPFAGREIIDGGIAASWAEDAFWPAASDQVSLACLFIGKHFLELSDGKLVNWLWLFGAGHGYLPTMEKHYHG